MSLTALHAALEHCILCLAVTLLAALMMTVHQKIIEKGYVIQIIIVNGLLVASTVTVIQIIAVLRKLCLAQIPTMATVLGEESILTIRNICAIPQHGPQLKLAEMSKAKICLA
jgi:hypothetical protein